MHAINRFIAAPVLGVSALMLGVALWSLGTDRWIVSSFGSRPADARTEIWGSRVTPVVATEAEWLMHSAPSRLHAAAAPLTPRIDLGPLDVIDVRPIPANLNLGPTDVEAGGPKLLVSAREPGSGRTVQFIVDAGSPLVAHQPGKPAGL